MAKSFREIDEEYEQKLAEQNKKIGERWAERQRRYADPTRMSREQYQHVMFGNAYDKNGLMAHEKDMLREKSAADLELQGKKNEGELAVAQEKRAGMREQGADAAQATAEAAMKTAELEWATKKGIAEMDAETKKDVAGMELEGKKYGADAQVDAETERGKANLEVAKQQGKDAQAVAEIQGGTAERVAATQAQAQAQKQNTPKVMSEADESKAARDLIKLSNGRLSYEQALAQVRAGKGGSGSGGLSKYRK